MSSSSYSFYQKEASANTIRHAIRYYHAIGRHRTTSENVPSTQSNTSNENGSQKSSKSEHGKSSSSNNESQKPAAEPAPTQYGSMMDLTALMNSSTPTSSSPNQNDTDPNKNVAMYQEMPSLKKVPKSRTSQAPIVLESKKTNEANAPSSTQYGAMTPELASQMKRMQGYQNGVVTQNSSGSQYQAISSQPMTTKQTNYEQYLTVQDLDLEMTESAIEEDNSPLDKMKASKSYKYSKTESSIPDSAPPVEVKKFDMEKLIELQKNLPADPLAFIFNEENETKDSIPHAQWKHDLIQNCEAPQLEGMCDCHTDWNERFQTLCDSEVMDAEKFSQMRDLEKAFVCTAEAYARIIILEQFLPVEQRTVKPVNIGGIAGGEKYICANILFKFAVDCNGLYCGDENAMKAAGHDLKGLMNYYHLMIPGFHFPLMTLIDYHGFRLQAIALLPISKNTLIYGSSDGGLTVHADNEDFNLRIKQAGKILNLKPHIVGESEPKELYSCADLEGHLGHDGRFYLLDFARVAPPEPPFVRGANLYKLFRFEFVRWYNKPLCPDAFSMMGKHNYKEHCIDIMDAHKYFIHSALPRAAARLSDREDIPQRAITAELHRTGVNCRYLGKMRQLVTPPKVKLGLLLEGVIRTLKCHFRRFLRDLSRKIRFGITEKSCNMATKFLNMIISETDESYVYWNAYLKNDLQAKFPGVLDDLLAPDFCLKGYIELNDCLVLVICEFMRVTGIRMRESSLKDFDLEFHKHREFEFNSGDIMRIESTTKHLKVVDYAEAMVFYYESFDTKSVFSRRRLLQLARVKIEPNIACNRQTVFVRLAQVFVEIAKTHKVKQHTSKAKIKVDFDEMRDLLGNAELLCVAVQQLKCSRTLALMANVIVADILVFEYKHLKATQQELDHTKICFSKLYEARQNCIEAINRFPEYLTALSTMMKLNKIIIQMAEEKLESSSNSEVEQTITALQNENSRLNTQIAELTVSKKKMHELEPPVVYNFELSMFEKVSEAWDAMRQHRSSETQPVSQEYENPEGKIQCESFKPKNVSKFSEAQAPAALQNIQKLIGSKEMQEAYAVPKESYPNTELASNLFHILVDLDKIQKESENNVQVESQATATEPQQADTLWPSQPAPPQQPVVIPQPQSLTEPTTSCPTVQYSPMPFDA